ncbi:MAG: HAMP domain-containing sensor histidine kinase [bacterium]
MNFKLAYAKLVISYVMIVMIISIAFSVVIFNISSREIGRGLNRQAGALRNIQIQIGNGDDIPGLEQMRMDQLDESSDHLKLNLIYFNLLILLLSAGASFFLARMTLQPIEEMMEAQNRFTADASHELRTPLTAMRTEIEVNLRDAKLDLDESKNLLKSNLEEIGKLEALSSSLLQLAQFQQEKNIVFKKIAISKPVADAIEKVRKIAEKRGIVFDNQSLDIEISGDRHSMTELFVILLDNAIKYSPEKSKITITSFREKDSVVVKVKDEGMGIKASDLPYIFNRFYRADLSRNKEKIDGYGLGLSIAKRITELHNGTIVATSKSGKGSEFAVRLPLVMGEKSTMY